MWWRSSINEKSRVETVKDEKKKKKKKTKSKDENGMKNEAKKKRKDDLSQTNTNESWIQSHGNGNDGMLTLSFKQMLATVNWVNFIFILSIFFVQIETAKEKVEMMNMKKKISSLFMSPKKKG